MYNSYEIKAWKKEQDSNHHRHHYHHYDYYYSTCYWIRFSSTMLPPCCVFHFVSYSLWLPFLGTLTCLFLRNEHKKNWWRRPGQGIRVRFLFVYFKNEQTQGNPAPNRKWCLLEQGSLLTTQTGILWEFMWVGQWPVSQKKIQERPHTQC